MARDMNSMNRGEFRPMRWAIVIAMVCLTPLVLMMLGIDFSSGRPEMTGESRHGKTSAEIGELAHQALRGSFTHTLLE